MALTITVGMRSSSADGDIYLGVYVTFPNPCDSGDLRIPSLWPHSYAQLSLWCQGTVFLCIRLQGQPLLLSQAKVSSLSSALIVLISDHFFIPDGGAQQRSLLRVSHMTH